jgi:hypothetical protein
LLNLYRHLRALRRQEPAFAAGDFVATGVDDELLMHRRTCEDRRVLVALNFGNQPRAFQLDQSARDKTFLPAFLDPSGSATLRAHEGLIVGLENSLTIAGDGRRWHIAKSVDDHWSSRA